MKHINKYYIPMQGLDGNTVTGFDVLGFATDLAKEKYPLQPNQREFYISGFMDGYLMVMELKKHNDKLKASKDQPGGEVVPGAEKKSIIVTE